MDESTDRSTEKNTLIIYIKYQCAGVSKRKFLCVEDLEASNRVTTPHCYIPAGSHIRNEGTHQQVDIL